MSADPFPMSSPEAKRLAASTNSPRVASLTGISPMANAFTSMSFTNPLKSTLFSTNNSNAATTFGDVAAATSKYDDDEEEDDEEANLHTTDHFDRKREGGLMGMVMPLFRALYGDLPPVRLCYARGGSGANKAVRRTLLSYAT